MTDKHLCESLRWFGQPATIRAAEVIERQAAELGAATRALEHVRQQAGLWKMEARTQKATVDEVGAALGGVPDWGPVVETVELMVAALTEARKDADRLDFIEANKDRTLRHYKRHWSFVGLTNYEYDVHKTLRAAIDAAMTPA